MSLSDSTADTTNAQPSAAQLRQERPVPQQMLDLRRDVEGHVRERRVERPGHGERVPRPVEEVGIAERDVGRPGHDLLADVRQHDVRRHDEEAAPVHGRDRAVPAEVLAAAARLDVRDQLVPPVALEPRVLLEGRQPRPARDRKRQPGEMRRRGAGRRPHPDRRLAGAGLERLDERRQRRLRLAADHRVHAVGEKVLPVQLRVQSVRDDVTGRVHRAHTPDQGDADPEGGVHRHRHGDDPGAPHLVGVEGLDGHVHDRRGVAARLEERRGPGHGKRLVAQLVARDQEDLPGRAHRASTLPPAGLPPAGAVAGPSTVALPSHPPSPVHAPSRQATAEERGRRPPGTV